MCMHFIQSSHHISSNICNHICHKKLQYNFQKWGGVKGRLEFFKKIIRFGTATRPYDWCSLGNEDSCVKSGKHLMIYLLDAATRTPSALGLSCQRHQPSHLCSHWGTIWAGHCQVARLVKYGILIGWWFEIFSCREVFGLWGLAGGATDDWYITQVIQNSKRL